MSLTPRQLEVLCLYGVGLRRQDIADLLNLEPGTVERHLQDIRDRLDTRSVAHSIVVSISRGYLVLDAEAESVSPVPASIAV